MPEVRKGYYEVEKIQEGWFKLVHPNEEFARAEEYDIILTELTIAFLVGEPPDLRQEFFTLANQFRSPDMTLMSRVLRILFRYRLNSIQEVPLLEPNAFQICIGTTWEDFCKIRAALLAYADYCIHLGNVLRLFSVNESNATRKEALSEKYEELVTVFDTKDFFINLLIGLTNVERSAIENILKFYTINIDNQDKTAGDGFFPPLVDYSHSYLFNPYILCLMLTSRNIIYVLNKTNKIQFDNIVSQYLEPTLLNQAVKILERLPDLRIVRNAIWSKGEFDLLIYQSSSNTLLHIQAKAPIPPQGARMTRAVEERSKEGIEQWNRFQDLSQDERDTVISEILNTAVKKVLCVSVLLCRAGLGTHVVWNLKKDIAVVNLPLLNGVIQKIFSENLKLSDFKEVTDRLLTDIWKRSVVRWRRGRIALNGSLIEMPLLNLNHDVIDPIRIQLNSFLPDLGD